MQTLQEMGSIAGKLAAGGLGGPRSLHSEPPSQAIGGPERQDPVEFPLPVVRLKPVESSWGRGSWAGSRVRGLEECSWPHRRRPAAHRPRPGPILQEKRGSWRGGAGRPWASSHAQLLTARNLEQTSVQWPIQAQPGLRDSYSASS